MSITRKPALIAASCLALAGGGTGAVLLATTSTAAASTSASAAQTGTGTANVSVTGPAGKTHTRTVDVSCSATSDRYTVSSTKQHAKRGHSVVLTVANYTGPGSYTAGVLISRHTAHSFSERTLKVPVTLTGDGGSLSYSKTLSGKRHKALAGKTVSATASWTCSL